MAETQTKQHPGVKGESFESRALIKHAFTLARELGIRKILVQADEFRDQEWVKRHQQEEILIWLTRTGKIMPRIDRRTNHLIRLPGEELTRMDQIQIGLMIAVMEDFIRVDETVLTLTGLVGSKRLDNLLITNLCRDNSWFQKHTFADLPKRLLKSQEFFTLLDIALRFAEEGREGKPLGTTFVLGDPVKLEAFVRPLILNPCEGHPKKLRSIHRPDFVETLRELAAIDGAFIIDRRGVVERAGVYLAPPVSGRNIEVREGHGARHTSAAAITAVTNAVAIVVSESSASVTAYYHGAAILELNRRE